MLGRASTVGQSAMGNKIFFMVPNTQQQPSSSRHNYHMLDQFSGSAVGYNI